jgi:Tfp pilus assembly protein PilF
LNQQQLLQALPFKVPKGCSFVSKSSQWLRSGVTKASLCCQLFCFAGLPCAPQSTKAEAQPPAVQQPGLRASADVNPHAGGVLAPLSPELRGDLYMARKMYREATDSYRHAPASADIYNKIGIAFEQLLRFDLAKRNYEEALKMNPRHAEALNNLGTVYYGERSYRKATAYYKRSLEVSGPKASVYTNLGAAYFARHNFKAASHSYEHALDLDPDILEHRSTLGTQIQEQTLTDRAAFHLYLAKAYAQRGVNQRALLYLRKALEEGVKDRKKIPELPEFSSLKKDLAFWELLAEDPKPL